MFAIITNHNPVESFALGKLSGWNERIYIVHTKIFFSGKMKVVLHRSLYLVSIKQLTFHRIFLWYKKQWLHFHRTSLKHVTLNAVIAVQAENHCNIKIPWQLREIYIIDQLQTLFYIVWWILEAKEKNKFSSHFRTVNLHLLTIVSLDITYFEYQQNKISVS